MPSIGALAYRALDHRYAKIPRTAAETAATAQLTRHVGGYLVWRRTILLPCTCLLVLACVAELMRLGIEYSSGQTGWVEQLVGPTIWKGVFCPKEPCAAADGMSGVFYAVMISDILLFMIAVSASFLCVQASRHWAVYRQSSRDLRRAYAMIFFAPFLLSLLLAPAQFVDVQRTQQVLCEERLRELIPQGAARAQAQAVCQEPIDQWATSLNQTLYDLGQLRDPETGTCARSQALLDTASAQFAAQGGLCENDEAALQRQAQGTAIRSCEQAASLGFCTTAISEARVSMLASCPLACDICVPYPACEDHDSHFAEIGNPNGLTSCAVAAGRGLCNATSARIRKEIRGTCPLACGICQKQCLDVDAIFDLRDNPLGIETCEVQSESWTEPSA